LRGALAPISDYERTSRRQCVNTPGGNQADERQGSTLHRNTIKKRLIRMTMLASAGALLLASVAFVLY